MKDNIERFYEVAAEEVATKQVVVGLMAKAFAECGGDEKAAIAAYLRLRVSQLCLLEEKQQVEEASRHTLASRAGRFYARHPVLFWAIIIAAVVVIFNAMR